MDEFSKNTDALGKKAEEILERAQNGSLNHEIEATLDSVLSSVVSGVSRTAAHMNQEMEKTRQRSEQLEREIRQGRRAIPSAAGSQMPAARFRRILRQCRTMI